MKRYNIEQIHDKFYIFDNWIMQFDKQGFSSRVAAQEYINTSLSLCDLMCNN